MAKRIVANRFSELLAIKERREGRTIPRREVMERTRLSKLTIDSYARNDVTRYDQHVIIALCDYFECLPGDLLVIEEVDSNPEMQRTPIPA